MEKINNWNNIMKTGQHVIQPTFRRLFNLFRIRAMTNESIIKMRH